MNSRLLRRAGPLIALGSAWFLFVTADAAAQPRLHPFVQDGDLAGEDEDFPLAEAPPVAPPFAEGDLSNDAFLPLETEVAEAFAEADAHLGEARAAATESARARALDAALESWARAAARAAASESPGSLGGVPTDRQEEGSPRLIEGIRAGLTRRLRALTPSERARWRTKFEGVAASGGDLRALAWPGTVAAAAASVRQLDRALESGALALAKARLLDASAVVALLDDASEGAPLVQALERRKSALANWRSERSKASIDWSKASRVQLTGSIQLRDRDLPLVTSHASPGRGVRPGVVALDERTLLVQTASSLWRVDLDKNGRPTQAKASSIDRALDAAFGPFARPRIGREAPGWELDPHLYRGDLLLVHGARGANRDGTPNALCRLTVPDSSGGGLGGGLLVKRPTNAGPRWVLSGDLLWTPGLDPGGTIERLDALADLADLEWQPGIGVVDGVLIAQARVVRDRTEAWLVGLDPTAGRVLWTRQIGAGAGLQGAQGRFAAAAVPRAGAPPLLPRDGRVLVSTQLGISALVDVRDGSLLWALATRRRAFNHPGWGLTGPFAIAAEDLGRPDRALLAPPDSDRLYDLRLGPLESLPGGEGQLPLGGPIRALQTSEALLGASADSPIVLRRDGRERTVALLRDPGQAPLDAFHLGPEESFRGRALVSDRRILAATDRALYLLDREQELALLDVAVLERRGDLPGGDVHAVGPWVVVLGFDALWVFSTQP